MWAGENIITKDHKKQNQNGRYFENFLYKNPNLSVANALSQCEGLITRIRHTKNGTQKSVLEFFVVCDKILPLVTKMTIDEKGVQSLTRYKGKITRTDHCMLELNINLMIHKEKKQECEHAFNVKNVLGQKQFRKFTSETNMFPKCFSSYDEGIDVQFKRWQQCFDKALHTCFRKVRVKANNLRETSKMDKLMEDKKKLLKQKVMSLEDKDKVKHIEN